MFNRDFRLYLSEIIELVLAIQEYMQDYTLEEFSHDRKTYSAVIRESYIIGEAVSKRQKYQAATPGSTTDPIYWRVT